MVNCLRKTLIVILTVFCFWLGIATNNTKVYATYIKNINPYNNVIWKEPLDETIKFLMKNDLKNEEN